MANKKIISFYDELSKNIRSPLELRNKSNDTSNMDIEFIKQYSNRSDTLLDIGSGTGLTVNYLINFFKEIIALEKYKKFSNFIVEPISIVNEDIKMFDFKKYNFDIATIFGVMNYFSEEESLLIYKKFFQTISNDGILIVKNQMGLHEDVKVEYSEELNSNYFSLYRQVDKEIENIEKIGFKLVEKNDIYPKSFNRFENTHFYALVFKKEMKC